MGYKKHGKPLVFKKLDVHIQQLYDSYHDSVRYEVTASGKRLKRLTNAESRLCYVSKQKQLIVKIENYDWNRQQSFAEHRFYREILEKEDAKYFPKLLGFSRRFDGVVVQQYIPLSTWCSSNRRRTAAENVVRYLVEKYGLDDDVLWRDPCNWGFKVSTEHPIIYDMGLYNWAAPDILHS